MGVNAKEWIELLVANAAGLRAAGVTRIKAEGFEAEIAPEVPALPELPRGTQDEDHRFFGDPLDDPETFGGHLPSYRSDGAWPSWRRTDSQ